MESNKLLKNTKFLSEVNRFFKENEEEIIDIILFGSTVKGKEKPGDVDILILFKKKKNIDLGYKLRKKLEKLGLETEITLKTYKELFESSFIAREAVLSEGYSLITKKSLAKGLGYTNLILFKYSLKGFNKSMRMRFYYSLYGRGKEKGMLKELNVIKFSETILLCPVENEEMMKEYLNNWNMEYKEFPILIPTRIKDIES